MFLPLATVLGLTDAVTSSVLRSRRDTPYLRRRQTLPKIMRPFSLGHHLKVDAHGPPPGGCRAATEDLTRTMLVIIRIVWIVWSRPHDFVNPVENFWRQRFRSTGSSKILFELFHF